MNKRDLKRLGTATFYLAPNIFGFAIFVLFPLIFSVIMAFTNWDLKQHNMFQDNSVAYVGLDNFIQLFTEDNFIRYLGNTVIMMLGIPFGIIGSLLAAMMLSSSLKGETKGDKRMVLIISAAITGVMLLSTLALMLAGMMDTAIMLVIISFVGVMLLGGSTIGSTVYRTVFYLPSFTSGVAIYLLWKKIYSPENGPLNSFLRGPLESFSEGIGSLPAGLVQFFLWIGYASILGLQYFGFRYLRRTWRDGETGLTGCFLGAIALSIPVVFAWFWMPVDEQSGVRFVPMYSFVATFLLVSGNIALVAKLVTDMYKYRDFHCAKDYGLGTSLMLCMAILVAEFVIIALAVWAYYLPGMTAGDGLQPPNWLTNYHWAKPSLILMGFWGAIGSNSMLLYLAGLSSVPQSLYEAAEIDGAKGFKKFWYITWPQLAPITFFIFVMAVIGGLQGGFEMAKTMTNGGPAGSTTTLAYYIYSEGFETGRLGYASAVAWTMFVLVFAVTMFNWKFGSKYTND